MSLVVNATKAQCSISVEGLLDTIVVNTWIILKLRWSQKRKSVVSMTSTFAKLKQEQDEDVKIIVQRHMHDASLWSDDSHTLI